MPDAPYNRMLASLEPITLAEMDSIRLMNRIDSKYVTDEVTLGRILADAFSDFRSVPQACAFVAEKSDFTADRIAPRMTTAFDRITLVNAEKTERLTIDLHLHFHNVVSGLDAGLGPAVIIELKQDGRADSRMKRILLERRAELIADLEKRVGVRVDNLEIGHVDFLKDAAFIKVYYTLDRGVSNSIDTLIRAKDFVEQ